MEPLSEIQWEVVIEGTGLQQSLLALALSRSKKKILHVDQNEYYGGTEAALSLQEVDEWVERFKGDFPTRPFRNASLWKSDFEASTKSEKLSFSRAYSLALSPQIIYTKSKLLAQLVSSKVYLQLEFQAVGNWWIYDAPRIAAEPVHVPILKRLPNGREDIFEDTSIDNRDKRALMKFLKFVVDYESHAEIWEPHARDGLPGFLTSQFKLPLHLQTFITALTLSLNSPEETTVGYSLPRIARHLTSIGVFGPGFGAVVPKWGGGAEIAQVACRAGAVGGGVYVLGTGISGAQIKDHNGANLVEIALSNGDTVKTKYLSQAAIRKGQDFPNGKIVSRIIAVVSSPLLSLFESSVEGSPLAAVSVVVFPPNTISVQGHAHSQPVYIMAHSSETGECPQGQCILYATMLHSSSSKRLLDTALATFLETAQNGDGKLLYSLYYEQEHVAKEANASSLSSSSPDPSMMDLAFDDEMLDAVEKEWRIIVGEDGQDAQTTTTPFMQFEERPGMNEEDEEDDD